MLFRSSGATPRRAVVGWDSGRLAMILAVLEARCGLSFSNAEVYLNIAGGYRVQDPAADMAVAAALVSALSERPVPIVGAKVRDSGRWKILSAKIIATHANSASTSATKPRFAPSSAVAATSSSTAISRP